MPVHSAGDLVLEIAKPTDNPKSTAFAIKLTDSFFPSLKCHQLAQVLHGLHSKVAPPNFLNQHTSESQAGADARAQYWTNSMDGVEDLCAQCQHPLPIQKLFEQCLCSQLSPIFLLFFLSEWVD